MKIIKLFFLALIIPLACTSISEKFVPRDVIPSSEQYTYQQMEMVGFIHFTVNTFTDKEWGYGDEDPSIFNPTELDAEQWVIAAKDGGIKELILTAKHHDGFCLWPSAYTEHSVKNSPFRDGKGDVVQEFVDACRKHGLKVGLYLSPWDRNHKDYGTDAYITYYRNQLTELLTQYGEINEIWFDGANGGDGYYGGADEERRVEKETYYDWETTFALVKELQPAVQIFSDAGPDLHWIGNEHGFAGETFWSTISDENLVIGASPTDYLNSGDPEGNRWIIGQCDVSIRPGWFYHESEDSLVKSPEELMDIYYKSVGRNGVLLLNLPPDRRGLIHETDVANLAEFNKSVKEIFSEDLAENALTKIKAGNNFGRNYYTSKIVDGDPETFWAAKSNQVSTIEFILDEAVEFDHIMIREPIQYGQRISAFHVEVQDDSGNWDTISEGTTIGYKRILRIDPVTSSRIRLVIDSSLDIPAISHFGLYKE
ncbi:MAG: alpha-L-fucosidase [Bacteroidales bacterium]|jgi:alpha-L-fucosidase|nr:alpha-L-fucosidase [Bacteroidales bacterium]